MTCLFFRNIEMQQCLNLLAYFVLYLFLMTNEARFQMVNKIINENKGKLNLHQLQNRFSSRLTSKMIRKYEFTNNKFLKKYGLIQRRYEKGSNSPNQYEWLENQRKLFIWFSIIFCNHLHRNFEELTSKDWETLSYLFFGKSIILLQYETKQIQRNPQRVHWAKREQTILLEAVKNGKLSQWNDISKRIFFETGGKYYKTSKQCREHWFNHLDRSKKKGDWLRSEDLLLLKTVKNQGRKWSTITHLLGERRTQHMVKNRYNSLIHSVMRKEEVEHEEDSILLSLIAKIQAEIQEFPEQQNLNENQPSYHQENNLEGQNSQVQEDESERILRQIVREEEDRQSVRERSVSSLQNQERKMSNQASLSIQNQGWNEMTANQSVQSPYYFVFSPFSFSSTASPYVNPYASWNSWTNSAHQTLFFNPQDNSNLQQQSSQASEARLQLQ